MDNREAIKELSEWLDGCCGGEEIEPTRQALRLAISALQAQLEIIRCKDCRFCTSEYDDVGNQYYSCTVRFDESGFWDEIGAEDFCSFAERKNNV